MILTVYCFGEKLRKRMQVYKLETECSRRIASKEQSAVSKVGGGGRLSATRQGDGESI